MKNSRAKFFWQKAAKFLGKRSKPEQPSRSLEKLFTRLVEFRIPQEEKSLILRRVQLCKIFENVSAEDYQNQQKAYQSMLDRLEGLVEDLAKDLEAVGPVEEHWVHCRKIDGKFTDEEGNFTDYEGNKFSGVGAMCATNKKGDMAILLVRKKHEPK